MSIRLAARFAELKKQNRAALVTYLCGGDPDFDSSLELLKTLPDAGADLIEIGMPFSDPMADGPTIQAGNVRALEAGASLPHTLELASRLRAHDRDAPIILMGYYNPIHRFGVARFLEAAEAAGVDGLIVVDLPAEEDAEMQAHVAETSLAWIRLATPTTDDARLPALLKGASGFLYYVSFTGITGANALDPEAVKKALARIRAQTDLPICVGFGVRTPEQAAAIAQVADGVVVGSALVEEAATGDARAAMVGRVRAKVEGLARGVRGARLT